MILRKIERTIRNMINHHLKLIISALMSLLLFADFVLAQEGFSPDSAIAWRSAEEERQIAVYADTNEAVVFITTISIAVDPTEFFLSLKPQEGTGSGCVVDVERGLILTNLHVVQSAQQIEVSFASGETRRARKLGVDPDTDIAVLQIQDPPPNLKAVSFADSSKLAVGQKVLAIGNPFGLNRTLTAGIISSLDRTVRGANQGVMRGLIQTDAAINPGNSGGALLDMNGRLIGINSAILSSSGDSAGIGFAVPINQIKRVLPDLIATGRVRKPRVGWALIDTNQGPFVEKVADNSPAQESGIRPVLRRVDQVFLQGYVRDFNGADLIISIDGRKVNTKDDVDDIVSNATPGQKLEVTLRRGGQRGRERTVTIMPVLQ